MIIGGLDTETTSKLSPEHRIIELFAQRWRYDPATGVRSKIDEKLWRMDPERSIDAKAFAVHNISLDDLKGCPTFASTWPEIHRYMTGVDLWVAHNGDGFDRPFIRLEVERVAPSALPFLDAQVWFDTMEKGRWAHPWGKVPSLGELCWSSDVQYDPSKAHAANYDVDVMMASFFFGLDNGFFQLPDALKLAA